MVKQGSKIFLQIQKKPEFSEGDCLSHHLLGANTSTGFIVQLNGFFCSPAQPPVRKHTNMSIIVRTLEISVMLVNRNEKNNPRKVGTPEPSVGPAGLGGATRSKFDRIFVKFFLMQEFKNEICIVLKFKHAMGKAK